jgi:predicted small lipoprotein YifL
MAEKGIPSGHNFQKEVLFMKKKLSLLLALSLLITQLAACGDTQTAGSASAPEAASSAPQQAEEVQAPEPEASVQEASTQEDVPADEPAYVPTEEELAQRQAIEDQLNLKNNEDQEWTYSQSADAWVLSVVPAVTDPVLPDQQGVSVAVPGAYVTGIDIDGDGSADVTANAGEKPVLGSLVIDYEAQITSSNGQTYTAGAAPVILTTGAAGYGSSNNSAASTTYAADGYISVSCGNRGKQDAVTDEDGNVLYYTGDAPSCLCDQKAAARFVKYNILLGNLPGSVDYFVSTGGSGGAAHAAMFAATSNNPDFYDYQIEAGAVGVYQNSDGSYVSAVTIDGETVELSDGAWGCVAYSAITPLYEGDMAQAFEYYMDTTYEFNTPFQAQLAEYLSQSYMAYINEQNLTVEESKVGFDLNGDGDLEDTIDLTIQYDPEAHPETNGYYGTYLDLYLCEFTENLQWYLDSLDYAQGWTWFDESGSPLSDEAVAAMTQEDKSNAFLEGRYTKGSSNAGGPGGMMGGLPDGGPMGDPPGDLPADLFGADIRNGGPDAGTTASAGSGADSSNYESFAEMAEAYDADIQEIYAGDQYGKNIVSLYNPLNYIGAEGTEDPTWTHVVMGAVEGDMPMMTSLNLELAWLSSDVDAEIEWQWDGGHVPSEILGNSLSLYVDEMYGKHAGGTEITKASPEPQQENGDSTEASGTDISSWATLQDGTVSFTLADVLAYRNTGASKAVPGFDVMDYGQEDYVFGNADVDARHWDVFVNDIFQDPEYAKVLESLWNAS